jgi:hypothetical protein
MRADAELFTRYRPAAAALAFSAALHAAVFVGIPPHITPPEDTAAPTYSATLDPAAQEVTTQQAAPAAAPRPRRARSPLPKSRIAPPPEMVAAAQVAAVAVPAAATPKVEEKPAPEPPPAPPEQLALAQPAVPVKALEPEKFPVEALPASVSVEYQLTSAFADGRAAYHWDRDGDSYRIRGEAEAEGFFTLFLEGRIVQESRGTVTASGLKPERFTESKPGGSPEGLEFDWAGRQVTFDRNGEKKVTPLTDNTVDWLSMIFQLAHMPPTARAFDLQVFTQRRMYRFRLDVVGTEDIDIPMGRVRALHLRHDDAEKKETVDVWLGIDQHYLPVKLRYPVARNRLVVEQVATRVTTR